MPMREQPDGVHRKARGDDRPASAYDVYVDGQYAGWAERLRPHKQDSEWRFYRAGEWPRTFGRPGGYLAGVGWLAGVHRAARSRDEPVTATEDAGVRVLSPVVSDPFRGEPFADPLAP